MFVCMFARGPAASRPAVLATLTMVVATVAAGCGGSDSETAPAADPGDVAVIKAWARTLAAGDEEGAAGYFAIPSIAENGPTLVKIESRADAVAFNRALPCGAEVVSARTTGRLTTATFVLSERPGGDCGTGTGATASTTFEIEDGKIVEWRRVDDAPTPGAGGGEGGTEV